MTASSIAAWMLEQMKREGCIYQEDVVDYLVKADCEEFLKENADGNQVLERVVLSEFMKLTETSVVWVKSERYWRFRVAEDELGREARG